MAISGGMISNPKRSVTVDMEINALKKRVKSLYKVYTSIDISYAGNIEDDFTNTFQYKVKEGGLSMGANAVITLKKESDNSTTIEVEMQRVIGSYDTDIEVSNANAQLTAIFNSLSILAQKTDDEVDNLSVGEIGEINTGLGTTGTVISIVLMIIGLIWLFS